MGKYIQSVDDLIDDIQNKGFESGRLLFRGHANYEWRLLPSMLRFENDFALRLEAAYLEPLLRGKKIPFLNTNDPIVLMMNLQHFGAPTRLLDWTFDPLIALFFACYDNTSKNDDIDGNLFFINKNLYKSFEIDNKENEFFKQSITTENVERFIKRSIIDSIYVIEPMIKNPRLRVQNACFMFFSFLPAKKMILNLSIY